MTNLTTKTELTTRDRTIRVVKVGFQKGNSYVTICKRIAEVLGTDDVRTGSAHFKWLKRTGLITVPAKMENRIPRRLPKKVVVANKPASVLEMDTPAV